MSVQRIRTIKPEFFVHEGLAEVTMPARLLFVGLWTVADRDGRLEDRPRRLKAQLFPHDAVDVDLLLEELATRAFIRRYVVEGHAYIDIPAFLKHQRPNVREAVSEIPVCPITHVHARASTCVHEPPARAQGTGTGTGKEREGKGTGRSRSLRSLDATARDENRDFNQFWAAYPRHEGKQDAWKAWKNTEHPPIEEMLAALTWQREQPRWREENRRFVPHPATYLNHRRWEDERPAPLLAGTTSRTSGNMAAIARGLEIVTRERL